MALRLEDCGQKTLRDNARSGETTALVGEPKTRFREMSLRRSLRFASASGDTARLESERAMKVTGPRGAAAPPQVGGVVTPSATKEASKVAPADAVSIAGVPEAELTPRVRAALVALMQEVADLRRELAETRKRMSDLESLASADPLLGILNRRAFVGELNRALAMSQRYRQPSSLIFIDLDELKKINDSLGHAAGDAALSHVAAVVSANIRQTDIFGRLGGDEFAVILTNTGKEQAERKARSLADLVRSTPPAIERAVSVTCGVVEISGAANAEAALVEADKVMYEEKRRR